jgi:glutathione peroxidase-family protein
MKVTSILFTNIIFSVVVAVVAGNSISSLKLWRWGANNGNSWRSPASLILALGSPEYKSGPDSDSFYSLIERDNEGNDVSFEKFRGKVVVGVNIGPLCSAHDLEYLSAVASLQGSGVDVAIAVYPCSSTSTTSCSESASQEAAPAADLGDICSQHGLSGSSLTVFTMGDVNGASMRPTYRFLKAHKVVGDVVGNFAGKFIVDKVGKGTTFKL